MGVCFGDDATWVAESLLPPQRRCFASPRGLGTGEPGRFGMCGKAKASSAEVQQERVPCMRTGGANKNREGNKQLGTPGKGGKQEVSAEAKQQNAGAKAVGQT